MILFCNKNTNRHIMKNIAKPKLLLCNIKQGQVKDGCQYGPKRLFLNSKYDFFPIVEISDQCKKPYQLIYNETKTHNGKILVLGGDHSIGMSTVFGSLYKYKQNLKVVWIDAHADINTEESSLTKNKHGMPVSPLFNLMKPWIRTKKNFFLKPEQFTYVGLRNLDKAEYEFLSQIGMEAYFAKDVENIGYDKIIDSITKNKNNIYHVSLDIDAMDPKYAPSTGTPEPEGLSLDGCKYIIERLKETNNLKHLDLVEYNPQVGNEKEKEITLNTCLTLIKTYME